MALCLIKHPKFEPSIFSSCHATHVVTMCCVWPVLSAIHVGCLWAAVLHTTWWIQLVALPTLVSPTQLICIDHSQTPHSSLGMLPSCHKPCVRVQGATHWPCAEWCHQGATNSLVYASFRSSHLIEFLIFQQHLDVLIFLLFVLRKAYLLCILAWKTKIIDSNFCRVWKWKSGEWVFYWLYRGLISFPPLSYLLQVPLSLWLLWEVELKDHAFSRTLYFVAKTLVVVFLLLKFSIIRFVKLQKFGIMIPVQLRICSVIFLDFKVWTQYIRDGQVGVACPSW